MNTVDRYVRKKGFEPVIREISEIVEDNSEPHEFAMNNKVEMSEWFEFLWSVDNAVSQSSRHISVLAMPEFNYVEVEDEFVEFVNNNSPIGYGQIVDHVYGIVDTVSDREQVARWGEFLVEETDDEDRIVEAERCYNKS